jgi:hypothetical protein
MAFLSIPIVHISAEIELRGKLDPAWHNTVTPIQLEQLNGSEISR